MGCIGCMTGIRVMYFDQNFETEMAKKEDGGSVLNVYKRNGDKLEIDISFCPWCGQNLRIKNERVRRVDGSFRKANYR